MSIDFMKLTKEQNANLTIKDNNNNQNELVKKKKKQTNVPPTIRFNIEIEKPSSDHFTECNYNKLVLKTLKHMQKNSKTVDSTKNKRITQNELPIIDKEFCIEYDKIPRLISMFRKKIALNKHLNDDDDLEINENKKNDNIEESMEDKNDNEKDDSENEGIDIVEESDEDDDDNDDDDDDDDNDEDHDDSDGSETDSDEEFDDNYVVDESYCDDDSLDNSYDIENKRLKLQNFTHLGIGYDENDSFIDNSEVIDERLPSNLVPKHGGFYINKAQQVKLVTKEAQLKVSKQMNNKKNNIESIKSDDDNSNIEDVKNNIKKNSRKFPISDDECSEKDGSKNYNNHANGELCAKKKKLEHNIMESNNQQPSNLNKTQLKSESIETNDKNQVKKVIATPLNNNNTNQITLIESNKKIQRIDDGSTTSKESKYEDESIEKTTENKNTATTEQISITVLNNLSEELKNLILYVEKLYIEKKLKNDDFWSQNARNILLKIYVNTRESSSNEKSQIFSYLASKLNISKSALLKRCKRLYSKETSSEISFNSAHQQQKNHHQHIKQNLPQQQNQQQIQQQKSQPQLHQKQQQLTESKNVSKLLSTSPKAVYNLLEDNLLDNALKEKISNLLQTFKQFKLNNSDNNTEFTFEMNNYLFSIDSQARKLYNNQQDRLNKIYDFIACNLSMQKDTFNRKLVKIRNDFMEKQLQNLINKFKNELDKEMKIQIEKHNQSYAEFMKKLTVEQQTGVNDTNGEQKKKIFGPRKKFQWPNELRDQLRRIINLKISFISLKDINHGNNLELLYETIKMFLLNSLLNLWPDGWMQINALINECATFVPQIQQYKQQSNINKVNMIQQLQTQQHQNLKVCNQQQSTKKHIQQQSQQTQNIEIIQKQNNNHTSQNQNKLINIDPQKQVNESSKNFIQTSPINSTKGIQKMNSTQLSQHIYKQVPIGQNKSSNNQMKSPSQTQIHSSKSTSTSPHQVQSTSNTYNNSNSNLKTSSNNTNNLIPPNFPFTNYHNPWSALTTLNYQSTNISIDTLNTFLNELVKKNTTDTTSNLNKN